MIFRIRSYVLCEEFLPAGLIGQSRSRGFELREERGINERNRGQRLLDVVGTTAANKHAIDPC